MKKISCIFLILLSCTNDFEEYISLPVKDTNFQTQKIEELEKDLTDNIDA